MDLYVKQNNIKKIPLKRVTLQGLKILNKNNKKKISHLFFKKTKTKQNMIHLFHLNDLFTHIIAKKLSFSKK